MENIATTGAITAYNSLEFRTQNRRSVHALDDADFTFVLYGIFRYQLLSDPQEISRRSDSLESGGQTERPEEVLLKDKPMLLTVLGWVVVSFCILLLQDKGLIP